jgi:lipopolysaccharide transport system permease protein
MLLALKQRISLYRAWLARDYHSTPVWVIDADRMGFRERVVEFWRFRRILWFFAVRMLMKRYQGTTLGVFWLFFRPLAPILIGTLVFGSLLKASSDGLPYFLFFLVGSAGWNLFDQSLLWATRSLDMNKAIIKKVYFPRLIIPVSSASASILNALIYGALMLVALFYYLWKDGRWYLQMGPEILLALLAGGLMVLFGVALGLWTSVWQVRHRDVRYGLRYFTRFWFYLTPVMWPVSIVPPDKRWIVFLNPMAAYIETFKWGLLGISEFYGWQMLISTLVVLVVLVGGIWYFGRAEAASVDAM